MSVIHRLYMYPLLLLRKLHSLSSVSISLRCLWIIGRYETEYREQMSYQKLSAIIYSTFCLAPLSLTSVFNLLSLPWQISRSLQNYRIPLVLGIISIAKNSLMHQGREENNLEGQVSYPNMLHCTVSEHPCSSTSRHRPTHGSVGFMVLHTLLFVVAHSVWWRTHYRSSGEQHCIAGGKCSSRVMRRKDLDMMTWFYLKKKKKLGRIKTLFLGVAL